ncbi:hypothetical protein Aph02nite_53430 [Actinoplanes philippinensis]|uniref:Secreted protein n=1 Tax=Actinoplanes philippinensis TaxID=35752 RepID=A0A1I2ILJ5_9ACTN|nr:hypothetical protein [Actinoplanes philippinensis]GIE79393.1 hypothetical protein Aph02nite_53430 [Actinoplanes philippinensis]SFF41401.1 hypothetical protein SAMN05421541_11017 [Actinoplanes philippinensis]
MIKNLPSRRAGEFLVAMTLVTGMTMGAASSASAAGPAPDEGKPCSFEEVGDQLYTLESARVSPIVTHFTSFYVTTGTLSENTYRLNVVDRVGTTINGNSGASETLFEQVTRTVGFSVRTDESTTNTEDLTVKWRFNNPGYYGLYKGTRRVTGTFSHAVCTPAWGYPRYVRRGSGTYTTFGHIEEGTVGCGDVLPPKSVRRAAQVMLGCPSPTPVPAGKAAKPGSR